MGYILITGCTGFIGSKLTQILLEEGFEVIGISNSEKTNIIHSNFKYINIDITDCLGIESVFNKYDITTVIHLAAIAHVKRGQKFDWNIYYRVNTLASKTIFECAARVGADVFFASTVDVYGACRDIILTEESIPQPITYYALSKFLAEKLLLEIAEKNNLNYVISRFAPVYSKELMKDIYKRIYIKYPKIGFVVGKGLKYQFVSIYNIIDFVIKWIKSEKKLKGIFNFRDVESIDSKKIIDLERKMGKAKNVIYIPEFLVKFIDFMLSTIYKITKSNMIFKLNINIKKIISPPNYSCNKIKEFFLPYWSLEETVYYKY